MAAGQVICCALGIACTSTADDESDIASDIKAGYAADAYFADGKNTRKFVHKDGGHYKDGAVVLTADCVFDCVEKFQVVVPRWQQDSEAVAFKFDCAIPKGMLRPWCSHKRES